VIAPVFFMENLSYPWNRQVLRAGYWPIPLPPAHRVQLVSAGDVAHFAALVIERRDDFAGYRTEIAADEVTGPQAAGIMSVILNRPISHTEAVPEPLAPMAPFFRWIAATGFHADIQRLRMGYPEVGWQSLQQWATAQDWSEGDGNRAGR